VGRGVFCEVVVVVVSPEMKIDVHSAKMTCFGACSHAGYIITYFSSMKYFAHLTGHIRPIACPDSGYAPDLVVGGPRSVHCCC